MSQKTKSITVDDLWKIQRPASPSLSPDGAQACVAVTKYDMEENKASTHLWLLSTFGGAGRELTQCGEKDGQPLWSPDGSLIAFVGKRGEGKNADDEPQLYVIAPDGGEAQRISNIATGVSAIKWFPDSSKVAFISWVWPELKGEKAQAKQWKEKKDDKVKAHVVDTPISAIGIAGCPTDACRMCMCWTSRVVNVVTCSPVPNMHCKLPTRIRRTLIFRRTASASHFALIRTRMHAVIRNITSLNSISRKQRSKR